jgi:hypothetical protein
MVASVGAYPRLQTTAFRRAGSRNQSALSFGVLLRVSKSTWMIPKRLPKPAAHSRLS